MRMLLPRLLGTRRRWLDAQASIPRPSKTWHTGVLGLVLVCLTSMSMETMAAGIYPIGFERWTPNYDKDSGAFVGKTFSHVYSNWATQLVGPGLIQPPQKDKRLIDIEVRYDKKAKQPLVSGVWVENVGSFRKSSWLIAGVLASELDPLIDYLKKAKLVVRDIERYQRNPKEVYLFALLVEPNPFELEWEIFTGLVSAGLARHANDQVPEDFRMLDLDVLELIEAPESPGPLDQAAAYVYDLIIIENPPSTLHHVHWEFRFVSAAEAMQFYVFDTMVDVEGISDHGLYAIIVSGEALTAEVIGYNLDAGGVAAGESGWGPARDIEGVPSDEHGVYGVFFVE